MGRPETTEEGKVIETWEITFEGSVWVFVFDRREDRFKKQRVGGRAGSKRLHISRDDRKFNQEQIPDENRALDPFVNGALRLIQTASPDEHLDTRYHKSRDELVEYFEVRDPELFAESLEEIDSELVLRRMQALGAEFGTVAQTEALRDLLELRYPVGGTQKTVREMIEAGERIGAQRI